ncbi:DUF6670 family protein [Acinetobacter dispersus]|uniref:DUF6670 family protein n=1 Tax=Acinetobacter dispersus TaxID=70348 RepID=UPI00132EE139|nr:DUF6670 family protein [Acinetobacter dispersus]QHH96154.1 hypothetical protein FPL17_00810 [Acinetobacter dispersus]
MSNQWPALTSFIKQLHHALDKPTVQADWSFPPEYALKPEHRMQQRGWSRYGVIIPDLPYPHHFFTFLSIMSSTAALTTEADPLLQTRFGQNAMIVTGTAAKMAKHFQSYSVPKSPQSFDHPAFLKFGKEITIEGRYPDYHVAIQHNEFELDIGFKNTNQVSWFIQMPMYDHFSLLSHYEGLFNYQGVEQKISGLCTFEYAFCMSPITPQDQLGAANEKIPLDFSTYHIISLDDQTQLLLNETHLKGEKVVSRAFLRNLNGESQNLEAEFEVLSYQSRLAVAIDGRNIKLPYLFRWLIKNQRDNDEITIYGEVDTTMLYGVGNGYVGGYHFQGIYLEAVIEGRAYMEYVDRRAG